MGAIYVVRIFGGNICCENLCLFFSQNEADSKVSGLLADLHSTRQQLHSFQEIFTKEKGGLQQEIDTLTQQKVTSESLAASLQTQLEAKEKVVTEEKRQNGKLVDEMEAKDELITSLKDQLQSAEDVVTSIRKEEEMEKIKLIRQLEDVQEQVRMKEKVKGRGWITRYFVVTFDLVQEFEATLTLCREAEEKVKVQISGRQMMVVIAGLFCFSAQLIL